jgi:hypothetical protein
MKQKMNSLKGLKWLLGTVFPPTITIRIESKCADQNKHLRPPARKNIKLKKY